MITNTLLIWLLCWAATMASMGFALRQAAKHNGVRASSASLRTLWGSSQGRAFICLLALAVWPVFVPVILYAAWDWLTNH